MLCLYNRDACDRYYTAIVGPTKMYGKPVLYQKIRNLPHGLYFMKQNKNQIEVLNVLFFFILQWKCASNFPQNITASQLTFQMCDILTILLECLWNWQGLLSASTVWRYWYKKFHLYIKYCEGFEIVILSYFIAEQWIKRHYSASVFSILNKNFIP